MTTTHTTPIMRAMASAMSTNPTNSPSITRAGPRSITIAVDPVALITTECITVTSAMRKHARWANSSVSAILGGASAVPSHHIHSRLPLQNGKTHHRGASQALRNRGTTFDDGDDGLVGNWGRRGKKGKSMQDNPLMSAFARLRSDLRGCIGMLV